jgi:hypothetical protein
MYAVEFETVANNGVINIPAHFAEFTSQPVRVVLMVPGVLRDRVCARSVSPARGVQLPLQTAKQRVNRVQLGLGARPLVPTVSTRALPVQLGVTAPRQKPRHPVCA